MTQYPGYASPSLPPANPRPTSVTVLAIIGIIAGVLGVVCNGFGIVGFLMLGKLAQMGGPNGQPNPALQDAVQKLESIMPILIALAVVKALVGIVAIAGGIGSLSLKPWGRLALLGYSVVLITLTIAEMVISLTMMPDMQQPGQPQAQKIGNMAGGVCGAVFWLIYPVCVLIFMNKANVKAAFAGTGNTGYPGSGGYGGGGAGMYPPPQQQQYPQQ